MKRFLAILSLLFLTLPAAAQDTIVHHRPKVGVVLSGGGAKGFAHIGALKVIEEAGIPIDYIGGTSMGSIVGGLYAVGYDPETLQKVTVEQDWNRILQDKIPRKFLPLDKRVDERHYLLTMPFKDGKFKIKRSVTDGVYVNMLLTRLTMPTYKKRNFDELPIPFLCIGTDMISSDAIEFRSGSLAQAIRSSMSIPLLFEPIRYNEWLLCDGGLKNNFPVRNVRNMGADIIIGVDLELTESDVDHLDNSVSVLERLIAVVAQDESNKARKDCDILIFPDVGSVNMLSFNEYDPILKSGEEAARQKFPELKKLADSLQSIEPFEVQRLHTQPIDSVYVSAVMVEGVSLNDQEIIKSEFGDDYPRTIAIDEIETIIVKIYSQGYYSNLWYELLDTPEGNILQVHCKSQTSFTFAMGMHYDNNYGIGMLLNMTAKTDHFAYNVDVNVSENPYFKARLTHRQKMKLRGGMELSALNMKASLYNFKGSIIYMMRVQQNALDLYAQYVPTQMQMFKLGAKAEYILFKNQLYEAYDQQYKHNFMPSLYFRYFFNNEDETYLARRGWNIDVLAKCIMYDGVFSNSYNQPMYFVKADVMKSFPIGQHQAFKLGATGACRLGDHMLSDEFLFFAGGQSKMKYLDNIFSFTGLPFVTMATEYCAYARTAWQWNFYKYFYTIVSCDMGYFKDFRNMDIEEIFKEATTNRFDNWFVPKNYVMGAGLTLGAKTVLGPIEFQVSKANVTESWDFFVNIGYWF